MPDEPSDSSQTIAQIQANLHELARLLRQARHLSPEEQQTLADLLDELGGELDPGAPSAQIARVADTVVHLARALHERHDTGLVEAIKQKLEAAVARTEVETPFVAGIVRRILDALANMGI